MKTAYVRSMIASIGLTLLLTSPIAWAQAGAKIIQCEVLSLPGQFVRFSGKCIFQPEGGGSFSLSAIDNNDMLYDNIAVIHVMLVAKGVAEVSGLVIDSNGGGHSSRWGQARRTSQRSACWDGADFRICAR